ncbi:topology modulation protein [Sphingomonas humi]|uniref:ATPase AAA n=1 Tax=Sphingomonas humi TaxID=335630 RepID=A0ABP7S8K6_9SPHN
MALPQRIMIVGQPGSGKSTLARRIGDVTGLPVIHIDRIHWQSGWVERSKAEKRRLCLETEAGERWIFEGGFSPTWPSRLRRADLLIWVDRPMGLRLWRVLRRALTQLGRTRPDMADGCPERLSSLPEFAHYILTTGRSQRRRLGQLATSATCQVERLRSDEEAAALVDRLRLAFATQSV